MLKPVTLDSLKQLIVDDVENQAFPDFILAFFKPFNGKKLTSRHLNQLNELLPGHDFRLLKHYGWTELVWGASSPKTAADGGNMMLARSEKNVEINVEWIEKENARWFSALRERNAKREKLLEDEMSLGKVAEAINAYRTAKATLIKLLKDEDGNHGFEPINSDLQALAGLKSLYE